MKRVKEGDTIKILDTFNTRRFKSLNNVKEDYINKEFILNLKDANTINTIPIGNSLILFRNKFSTNFLHSDIKLVSKGIYNYEIYY